MKKIFFILIAQVAILPSEAQKIKTSYSEKMKLDGGAFGLKILGADNQSLYFSTEHQKKDIGSFFIANVIHVSSLPKISKFDKQTTQLQIEKTYKKELGSSTFENIQYVQGRIFLFSTTKKGDLATVSSFEIDKSTLNPKAELNEIATFKYARNTDLVFSIRPSYDSSCFVITSPLDDNVSSVGISVVDLNFNSRVTTSIVLPAIKKEFWMYDILYTKNEKILVSGNKMEPTGQKNIKQFTTYVVQAYEKNGQRSFTINGKLENYFFRKLVLKELQDTSLLITSFYFNDNNAQTLSGLLIKKVNLANGSIIFDNYTSLIDKQSGNSDIVDKILADNSYAIKYVLHGKNDKNILLIAEAYYELNKTSLYPSLGTGSSNQVERTDIFYKNLLIITQV